MMPKKNNDIAAAKSKMSSRSTAKYPLRDISNAQTAAAVNSVGCGKKTSKEEEQVVDHGSQDRLLLVHSDISSVLQQIDELVVQALQQTSSKGMKEVKQFADVLSEMQASLKPWVPRLREAMSDAYVETENKMQKPDEKSVICVSEESEIYESPKETKWKSLVSPSPLVTWRAERETGGRQLFLLTPLHRTKTFLTECPPQSVTANEKISCEERAQSVSHLDSLRNLSQNLIKGASTKPAPDKTLNVEASKNTTASENEYASPARFSTISSSKFVVMTPCSKMSPFKSCVLLEPISEFGRKKNPGRIKSTPFPTRKFRDSLDSESSSSEDSDDLSLKYQSFGMKSGHRMGHGIKVLEETPNWNMSPPKTCVIMEPSDESSECSPPEAILTDDQQAGCSSVMKTDHRRGSGVTHSIAECTPMIKESTSSFQVGKHPGENTLKKELWMKFEDSTYGIAECTPMIKESTSSFQAGKRPGENTLKKELWMKFEAASMDDGFDFKSIQRETSQLSPCELFR